MGKPRGKRTRPTKRMVGAQVRWRGLVVDQRASGKDVHEFCRERGVNAVAFYKWRKRLGLAPSQREESPATEAKAAAKLVSVRLTSKTPGGWGIEIQFPAGHVLRIGRGVDANVVTTVLAAMRAIAC
jgi:hypothetical protein